MGNLHPISCSKVTDGVFPEDQEEGNIVLEVLASVRKGKKIKNKMNPFWKGGSKLSLFTKDVIVQKI